MGEMDLLRTLAHLLFRSQVPPLISDDAPSASDSPFVSPLPSDTPVSLPVYTRPRCIRNLGEMYGHLSDGPSHKQMWEPTLVIPSSDEEDVLGQNCRKGGGGRLHRTLRCTRAGRVGNPETLFFFALRGAQMSRV